MTKNKAADNDWFRLESNEEGTRWWGKAWTIHEMLRYEFDIEFDVSDPFISHARSIVAQLDSGDLSDDCTGDRHTRSRWQNGEDVPVGVPRRCRRLTGSRRWQGWKDLHDGSLSTVVGS